MLLHPGDAANDSRVVPHRPHSGPTNQRDVDAKLELKGFEPSSIAELPPKRAEIHMRLVEREPLDRSEKDRQIERGSIEGHE